MIEIIVSDRQTHPNQAPNFRTRVFAGPDLCRSRTPIYDSARALLDMGHSPDELLVAYHQSTLTRINKPVPIGELAKWMVSESNKGGLRLRKWEPVCRVRGKERL